MKVFCSVLFLVAGLALSSSAPTPEECDEVLKVHSLSDRTKLHGKSNFIMGYSDHEIHQAVLRKLDSGTIDIEASGNDSVVLTQELNINGSCVHTVINTTIEGDEGVAGNVLDVASTRFKLYDTSDIAMGVLLNTVHRHPQRFLRIMAVDSDHTGQEELNTRSFYLISKAMSLTEDCVANFKKQAACLGFEGEPTFVYDGKTEMCGLDKSQAL